MELKMIKVFISQIIVSYIEIIEFSIGKEQMFHEQLNF